MVSGICASLNGPEILDKYVDCDDRNHQQAHSDKGTMEEGRFESEPTGQARGSLLEA